jgi:hypothetical protein
LPVLGLIEASRAVKHTEIEKEVMDFLTDETIEHTVHLQLGLLRAAHEHRRPGTLSGLGKVHARCMKDVTARLAQPAFLANVLFGAGERSPGRSARVLPIILVVDRARLPP